MTRQPIRWNQEAIEWVRETMLGVLVLVIFPISTLAIAAAIGSIQ